MNEFSTRLGAIAQNVGKDFALVAADDSDALIRRARRGRVVWTGAVGTASLASAAAIALGGSAAASSVFGEAATPAHHDTSVDTTTDVIAPVKAVAPAAESGDPAAAAITVTLDKKDPVKKKAATESTHKSKHYSKSKDAAKDGDCDDPKGDSRSGSWGDKWNKGDKNDSGSESGDDSANG